MFVQSHLPGWHTVCIATARSHYGPPPPASHPQKASAGPGLETEMGRGEWRWELRGAWDQRSRGKCGADLEGCSSGSCGQQQRPHGSGSSAPLSVRIQAPGPCLPGGATGKFKGAWAGHQPSAHLWILPGISASMRREIGGAQGHWSRTTFLQVVSGHEQLKGTQTVHPSTNTQPQPPATEKPSIPKPPFHFLMLGTIASAQLWHRSVSTPEAKVREGKEEDISNLQSTESIVQHRPERS